MKLSLLVSDWCFLFVIIAVVIWLKLALKKEHVRRGFRLVFASPIASSSAVILLGFFAVAILDSIHFQSINNEGIISILDLILSPLNSMYEKSYSAPMALNLYGSETKLVDGVATQVYSRLQYVPNFLENTNDVWWLFFKIFFKALTLSFVVVGCIVLVNLFLRKEKLPFTKAKHSVLITLFFTLSIIFLSYWLSRDLHILGTGKIGQDIFYYAVKSIRTGLIIGTLTTLFMMPLALLFGIGAGFYGGRVDDLVQYIYTTLSSIPGVLLITASVLSMQTFIANHPDTFPTLTSRADARLLALCFILGVTSWTSLCRLLRAETLKIKSLDYVKAAVALGTKPFKIMLSHLLPNVMHIVIITLVLDFSFLVLAEAVLSYVGVGVSPMTISWGNMINSARLELAREPIVWWPILSAFVFMFMLVLTGNLFADALRDAFDPRHN